MLPIKLFLALEEICLSEKSVLKLYINNTTQYFMSNILGYLCSPVLCLSWPVSCAEWGKDLSIILTSTTPKGPPHRVWVWANSGLQSAWMGLPCAVCVCLFLYVFMETAIPFRYITELECYSIRPERENWSGCPAGIYWCSVARVNSGTFNIVWEKRKLKRAHCRYSSTSCSGVFGLILDCSE